MIQLKITQLWSGQLRGARLRGNGLPGYTKEWFTIWLYDNGYERLFNTWKDSRYNKDLAPSVDRLDDNGCYTKDNIQLITWKENNDKGYSTRNSDADCKRNRPIIQLTLDGEFIREFRSTKQAVEITGVNRTSISSVISGRRNHAGGYLWLKI